MPDEMKPETTRGISISSDSLILGLIVAFVAVGLVIAVTPFMYEAMFNPTSQPLCDLNMTEKMLNYSIVQDFNQHAELAKLIWQSNYLMQCTIDTNSATTIEVPQADNSYRKYTKAIIYCPEVG